MKNKGLRNIVGNLMAINLNRQRKAIERFSLYRHWLCHFDEMDDIYKRQVFEDIYKDLIDEGMDVDSLIKIIDETLSPDDAEYLKSMLKPKSI